MGMAPSHDSDKLVTPDTQEVVNRPGAVTSSARGCSEGCRCGRQAAAGAVDAENGRCMAKLYPTGFLHELGPLLKLAAPIVCVSLYYYYFHS